MSAAFFSLLFLLSTPFWLVGWLVRPELLPGLPVSAAMVVCPVAAATLLVARAHGRPAVRAFLARAVDLHRMRRGTGLLAIGVMPLVALLSAWIQLATGGELPDLEVDVPQAIGLLALFLVAATAEELGWSGYATPPLVERCSVLRTGLLIGAIAVVWHAIPLLQAGRSWDWIAWWALGAIARRVFVVWIYARGGRSVFSASLLHAMSNLSWMLFPVMGSHYDPMVDALVMVSFAAALFPGKS